MTKVAVLIVTWNAIRLGHAADLVASLNQVDFPRERMKIFLGDNASSDGTAAFFKTELPDADVTAFGANLGFAEANNRLAAQAIAAGFDYAYLLNQDCIAEPGFVREAVAVIESDATIATVQSRLLLAPLTPELDTNDQPERLNTIGNAIHFLGFGFSLGSYEDAARFPRAQWNRRDISYASGAGMLTRLDLVARLGLFNPGYFMYHEDLDFGWQTRLAGFRTVVAFDSVVRHKYHFEKSAEKYYYLERNRFLVVLENYRLPTLLMLMPGLAVFEMGLLLFAWRQGFLKEKLRVYGYFLKPATWRVLGKERRIKQRRRIASDRQILRCMTGAIDNLNIDNWLLNRVANPCFRFYFSVLKALVFW